MSVKRHRLTTVLLWPLRLLRTIVARVMLAVIWFYRNAISPFTPPSCRFQPTCSAYAEEAVRHHGPLRGGLLALHRISRCHPFSRGGFDPVPEPSRASADAPAKLSS